MLFRSAYSDLDRTASTGTARADPFSPITLRTGLSTDEAILVRASVAGVPGTRVDVAPSREYESSGALAHVLGYVGAIPAERAPALTSEGYALDARVGLAGIETQYERTLRGTPGRQFVLADPQGRVLRPLDEDPATPGGTVVLSLDLGLQRAAQAAVQQIGRAHV